MNGTMEKYRKFVLWSIWRYFPDVHDTGLRKPKMLQTEKPSFIWKTEQITIERCRICMIFSCDYKD
jgi:hypothetical protein